MRIVMRLKMWLRVVIYRLIRVRRVRTGLRRILIRIFGLSTIWRIMKVGRIIIM